MYKVTRKSLHDSDIHLEMVERRLKKIAQKIKSNNQRNLTDINIICEEIFGKILNDLYGINMIALSAEVSSNFVAVDLVDYENRIAYQITSISKRSKIESTIKKFNESKLCSQIDSLNFLILDTEEHVYRGEETILLDNGREFSFIKNIINFNDLLKEISRKSQLENDFIIRTYDNISMVYDSGRLKYFNVVKETDLLSGHQHIESMDVIVWEKGYGDTKIKAFIPLSYEQDLSCLLMLRQHNLNGAYITFDEKMLTENYFVEESEFEKIHHVGRFVNEDEMSMQIENIRLEINAHTAYHVFLLFKELKKEYEKAQKRIEATLGTEKLKKIGKKYLMTKITKKEWKEILFFARNHDWFQEEGDCAWNIFINNWSDTSLMLAPNAHSGKEGRIFAKISVENAERGDDWLGVFWEPGYGINDGCMEGFDNEIKWRADYTKKWFEEKMMLKAHVFYEERCVKKGIWRRIWEMMSSMI